MSVTRVDNYWGERFGVSPGWMLAPRDLVVPHARAEKDTFVFVLVFRGAALVAAAPRFVEQTRSRLEAVVAPRDLLSPASCGRLLPLPVERTVGPAFQGFVDPATFRAAATESARAISSSDPRLRDLETACDATEWQHSQVGNATSDVFACLTGERVTAAAHYRMWADDVASIGVLTHPGFREQSFGKSVVSAAVKDAMDKGFLVVYQTLAAKLPSLIVTCPNAHTGHNLVRGLWRRGQMPALRESRACCEECSWFI